MERREWAQPQCQSRAVGAAARARDSTEGAIVTDAFRALIGKVATGATLTREEASGAFEQMMSGEATPSQMGALLMALRVRGETVDEITGAVTETYHATKNTTITGAVVESYNYLVGNGLCLGAKPAKASAKH